MLNCFSRFQCPVASRGSEKTMGGCPGSDSFQPDVFNHRTYAETEKFQNKNKLLLFGHFSEFGLVSNSEIYTVNQ